MREMRREICNNKYAACSARQNVEIAQIWLPFSSRVCFVFCLFFHQDSSNVVFQTVV
jgi:hypothetical protein